MNDNTAQSVCALVTNLEGEILALFRRDVPIWVLPGGGVEKGETPEKAVLREVLEETGFEVKIDKLLAIYEPKGPFSERTFFYACSAIGGKPIEKGDETLKTCFFSLDKLPSPFFPFHQEWIEDAKKPGKKPYLGVVNTWRPLQILLFLFRHPLILGRYLLGKCGINTNS